ncbi:MAG: hypothetical protein ACNI27_07550 [Desulfovibrio sp.]
MLPYGGGDWSSDKVAALSKGYSMLRYDLLSLTPAERALFDAASIPYPTGTAPLEDTTIIETKDGQKVGFVFFPKSEVKDNRPTAAAVEFITSRVKALRKTSDIVIGMSPWGYFPEQSLLKDNSSSDLPDIILGSGPGTGVSGRLMNNDKTMLVRPYASGKSINIIKISDLPKKNLDFSWTKDENIFAKVDGLIHIYRDDPVVVGLFDGIETE